MSIADKRGERMPNLMEGQSRRRRCAREAETSGLLKKPFKPFDVAQDE